MISLGDLARGQKSQPIPHRVILDTDGKIIRKSYGAVIFTKDGHEFTGTRHGEAWILVDSRKTFRRAPTYDAVAAAVLSSIPTTATATATATVSTAPTTATTG